MTVVIHSTDVGAPSLGNAAGSLIAILDYCLVGALGWTKPFSGTNKAVYQMPPGSNGHFLRVDDTDGTNNSHARIVGYETMSSIDIGTGPFPTAAQLSGGSYAYKGPAGSGRAWAFFGSGAFFHLIWLPAGTNRSMINFGQLIGRKAGDVYHTLLNAASQSGDVANSTTTSSSNVMSTYGANHSLCRSYSGAGSAVLGALKLTRELMDNSPTGPAAPTPFPDPVTGGLNLTQTAIMESPCIRRGIVPGLWAVAHQASAINLVFATGDTVSGQSGGDLQGRGFELQSTTVAGGSGWWAFETSDTWYT